MCKSKKKLTSQVVEPNQKSRRSSSSSTSQNTGEKSASYHDQSLSSNNNSQNLTGSTTSFIINNVNNNSQQSWASSSNSSRHSLTSLNKQLLFPEQPHIYNFSEIRSATQNFLKAPFSTSSTSTSWRCFLREHEVIIIQRKFRRKMETSEVVEHVAMICKSHHSSLIPLKGASVSGNYIYLVYEYIRGVNLKEALRNSQNPNFTVLSNWGTRIQIASDIAHGLDYIHNYSTSGLGLGLGFVHNHIKSTSIIVTEEATLHAKICHFGTAELCGETAVVKDPGREIGSGRPELKRAGSKGMKFEGTRGYMAPELQWAVAEATAKSDVYAFGVVILELVSGKEAAKCEIDEYGGIVRVSVIDTAVSAAAGGGGGLRRWVDRRLKDSYPVDVVEKLVRLGLDCVENDPDNRPDMGRVAGRISQMYLESNAWAEKFGPVTDFTVSLGPR